MSENGLEIEHTSSGRGATAKLTVRTNGDTIALDTVNLGSSKARSQFISELTTKRPGIDAAELEGELIRIGDELSKTDNPAVSLLPEIDVDRIVRPERFITPEVSGLAVPTMCVSDDRPVGQWLMYVRSADGHRYCKPMQATIELPESPKLWLHPIPYEPSAAMRSGWSRPLRDAWLKGADGPDVALLFQRICERIAHFLDLPQKHAPGTTATLALWTILTYCYQAWDALPYLFVGGPLGSGKSRVFEILSRLVFRPLSSSNLTSPALFRTLHNQGGTLLFDEAERLKETKAPDVVEIQSMLLAGYKKGGQATRLEAHGDSFRTVAFDVYGPKALACIAGLPAALLSRCITVIMFRAPPGSDKPRRRIDADPAGWQQLRDDLHSLALEHGPTWLELADRTDVCPSMSGRDFELWQPLLALASWIEAHGAKGLLELLKDHAIRSIEQGQDDQTPDHDQTLLRVLTEFVQNGELPKASDILENAKAEDDSFRNWSARAVSSHLKRYGLTTNKSNGYRKYNRVTVEDLREIQTTYRVDLGIEEPGP